MLVSAAQRRENPPRISDRDRATKARQQDGSEDADGAIGVQAFWDRFLANQPSWLVSLVVHLTAMLVLAWIMIPPPEQRTGLLSPPEPEEIEFGDLTRIEVEDLELGPEALDIIDRETVDSLEPQIDLVHAMEGIDAASAPPSPYFDEIAPLNDHFFERGRGTGIALREGTGKGEKGRGHGLAGTGQGLGGRGGRRGKAVGRGATPESEKAVNLTLEWLANHQLPDGGWSFDHTKAPSCHGQCGDPGEADACRIAATALGVLPFLGAGQTHQVGDYQKTVRAGLAYLMARIQVRPQGGSLYELKPGRMYSHGLATIALCEAYAMRVDPKALHRPKRIYDGSDMPSPGEMSLRDKQEANKRIAADDDFNNALGKAAQLALNFVSYAQDPAGGGWRYEPRQAGDMSVVGWQVMALKSGQMAQLIVNPATLVKAEKFLAATQADDYGADYLYKTEADKDKERSTDATQAIGLLCRMYTGWAHDHPGLRQGIEALDGKGPSPNNMYYNYYATQAVHHYGGEPWKRWNPRMRDSLVNRQSKAGHEAGSWFFGDPHGAGPGGRLYITALCAMTLQVYYRHMPLYRQDIFADAEGAVAEEGGADGEGEEDAEVDGPQQGDPVRAEDRAIE